MNHSHKIKPPITVGVITHSLSQFNFQQFLVELTPAIQTYSGACELIVVNNSGKNKAHSIAMQIEASRIKIACKVILVSSEENNIAIGRNLILSNASNQLVAMIDDDEFPVPKWLDHLVNTMEKYRCQIVAGPTLPLYLFDTPTWITHIDLHKARGKLTGQSLSNCASCNVLMNKESLVGDYFKPEYGRSGGEDTEFFLRQTKMGLSLIWSNEAKTYEYIPQSKSTTQYTLKRALLQGQLNRRILSERGDIRSPLLFTLRSIATVSLSLIVAPCLILLGHRKAGDWVKRGVGNLGHLTTVSATLYPDKE